MQSRFSHVLLFASLWTVAHQALLSMGFSRQDYWSGWPFPSPGIKPVSPVSPALAGRFFTDATPGKPTCENSGGLINVAFVKTTLALT